MKKTKIVMPKITKDMWRIGTLYNDLCIYLSDEENTTLHINKYGKSYYIKLVDLFKDLSEDDKIIGIYVDDKQQTVFISFEKTGVYYAKVSDKKLYKSNRWTLLNNENEVK